MEYIINQNGIYPNKNGMNDEEQEKRTLRRNMFFVCNFLKN